LTGKTLLLILKHVINKLKLLILKIQVYKPNIESSQILV